MDMDIPLPEELELLEAESRLHDSYQDFDPVEEILQDSPPPPQINTHKRQRSDRPDSPIDDVELPSDDKRSRIVFEEDADDEEDWLRYVPPLESNGNSGADEREVAVVAGNTEKIVSRYASAIDGDVVPVTAPSGGDRVYAKFCRVECEERVKKLDFKSQSNGIVGFLGVTKLFVCQLGRVDMHV